MKQVGKDKRWVPYNKGGENLEDGMEIKSILFIGKMMEKY